MNFDTTIPPIKRVLLAISECEVEQVMEIQYHSPRKSFGFWTPFEEFLKM